MSDGAESSPSDSSLSSVESDDILFDPDGEDLQMEIELLHQELQDVADDIFFVQLVIDDVIDSHVIDGETLISLLMLRQGLFNRYYYYLYLLQDGG